MGLFTKGTAGVMEITLPITVTLLCGCVCYGENGGNSYGLDPNGKIYEIPVELLAFAELELSLVAYSNPLETCFYKIRVVPTRPYGKCAF